MLFKSDLRLREHSLNMTDVYFIYDLIGQNI